MTDARALYARGAYHEAHEAWEEAWRALPPGGPARAALAGRIQLCAAALQARRGRWRGVATLAARAADNLEAAGEGVLAAAVRGWAGRIDAARAWLEPPPLG